MAYGSWLMALVSTSVRHQNDSTIDLEQDLAGEREDTGATLAHEPPYEIGMLRGADHERLLGHDPLVDQP